MERRSAEESLATVLVGKRLTRRAFLRAMAAAGVAVGGLAIGTAGAVPRAGSVAQAPAQQARPDRIADLAAELLYDVDEIYRFVRDSIRYEPYVGILRGAEGTLASRAGNSADQAVLLAALLDAAIIPYRFVLGPIDAATAEIVSASGALSTDQARSALEKALSRPDGGTSRPAPTPDAETQALLERGRGSAEDVAAWAEDQLRTTVSTIESTLRDEGIELYGGFSTMPPREVDEHVWVQAARGPEWLDLDPTLPTNSPGTALSGTATSVEELADDLHHRVEFAVLGEQVDAGRVSTTELMRISARADELAGLPITFLNADPSGVEQLAEAITPMEGVTTYQPILVVGDEVFGGSPIAFGRAGALETTDLLDGGALLGGGGPGETTAEWMELTIISPDRDPIVTRRAVFDRFGPAARTEGALDPGRLEQAAEVELPDGGSDILPAQVSTWLAVSVGTPDPLAPILDQTDEDTGFPGILAHGLQVYREMGDVFMGAPLGVRSFMDAPNIAAYTIRPTTAADGQDLVEAALDIIHRSRGTAPILDAVPQMPPAMLTGVFDHVIERLMSGDALDRATADTLPQVSVGAVFDQAERQGVGLRVVRTAEEVQRLAYPPGAKAMLASSLADGWLAIAPERVVSVGSEERAGWWLVDPVRGLAVDQLDDGRGGLAEKLVLHARALANSTAFRKFGVCLFSGVVAAAGAAWLIIAGIAASLEEAWKALLGGAMGIWLQAVGVWALTHCLVG